MTTILDNLAAAGGDYAKVLRNFPTLKREHLDAALAYAAELAREEYLLPLTDLEDQDRREPVASDR